MKSSLVFVVIDGGEMLCCVVNSLGVAIRLAGYMN
jgi:hypothetical protein